MYGIYIISDTEYLPPTDVNLFQTKSVTTILSH